MFVSLPVARTTGIQMNEVSIYNSFRRETTIVAMGEMREGLPYLQLTFLSLDRAVHLQPLYLCLQSGYTNFTNLGAVVSLSYLLKPCNRFVQIFASAHPEFKDGIDATAQDAILTPQGQESVIDRQMDGFRTEYI